MIKDFHAKLAEVLDGRDVLPAASVLLGGEHLARGGKPPRIVMVPVGGPGGAGRIGPAGARSSNPRALRERHVGLDFHCWGEDYDGAELLLGELVSAVHSFGVGTYELEGESWPEANGDSATLGRLVVVRLVVRTPVLDRTQATGRISKTQGATVSTPQVVIEDDGGGDS